MTTVRFFDFGVKNRSSKPEKYERSCTGTKSWSIVLKSIKNPVRDASDEGNIFYLLLKRLMKVVPERICEDENRIYNRQRHILLIYAFIP